MRFLAAPHSGRSFRGIMPDPHATSTSAHTPPADELQAAVTDVVRPLVAKHADASITVAAVTHGPVRCSHSASGATGLHRQEISSTRSAR